MPKFKIDILVERVDRETYIVEAASLEESQTNVLDGSYEYPDAFETVEIRSLTHDSAEQLPAYEHDCDHCLFLGCSESGSIDLYLHHRDDQVEWSSLIARHSSVGQDYQSMPLTVLQTAEPELPHDHPLKEALARARSKKFL